MIFNEQFTSANGSHKGAKWTCPTCDISKRSTEMIHCQPAIVATHVELLIERIGTGFVCNRLRNCRTS